MLKEIVVGVRDSKASWKCEDTAQRQDCIVAAACKSSALE
jgi:hypothetical protein